MNSQRERESSNSKLVSNFKGQGTIEYLVIIAIVVVISLVVVGLMMQQMGSSVNVSKTSNKIGDLTQSIGITESLVSPTDGNFVLKLLNNSGSTITISNVKIGDSNVSFSEDLAQSGSKLFKVATSNVCELGKVVSEDVVVTYVSENGLTKIQRFSDKVLFDCSPFVISQANLANQCPSCSGGATGNAIDSQVLSPYTFSNSTSSGLTGSMATRTLSSSSVSGLAGYYSAFDLNVVDSDLNVDNVRSGRTIFGVTGTYSGSGGAMGNAIASQVLSPYTFSNSTSSGLTGSMATRTLSSSSVSGLAGYYSAFDLNVVDSDLNVDNVRSGRTIFGVTGTYSGSGGSSVSKYANLGSGQTTCWDVDGSVINCSTSTTYPGMDGNVYGASYVHSWSSTANTMLDLNSGLRWQKADNGSAVTWQAALQYCSTLSLDGYTSGWRLPTFSEISGMYNYQSGGCITGFSSCSYYWSSTSMPSAPFSAYYLNTYYGVISSGSKLFASGYSARCVRFES